MARYLLTSCEGEIKKIGMRQQQQQTTFPEAIFSHLLEILMLFTYIRFLSPSEKFNVYINDFFSSCVGKLLHIRGLITPLHAKKELKTEFLTPEEPDERIFHFFSLPCSFCSATFSRRFDQIKIGLGSLGPGGHMCQL